MRFRSRVRTSNGFVLLMVLVALVVVGVTLTQVSRASLRITIGALDHQSRLQRKWGHISCERAILPIATSVFQRSGTNILRDRVVLGDQTFDFVLADEDAKANLNTMYHAGGSAVVERELGKLVPAGDARTIALRPRVKSLQIQQRQQARPTPIVISDAPAAFRDWADVFSIPAIRNISGDDRQLVTLTRGATIFGRGPINVVRADDASLLAVLRSVVEDGLAKRVLEEIQRSATLDLNLILERAVTDVRDRQQLSEMLTANSATFSLWSEISDEKSRHQGLAVIKTDNTGLTRTDRYAY